MFSNPRVARTYLRIPPTNKEVNILGATPLTNFLRNAVFCLNSSHSSLTSKPPENKGNK